ncbi:MAG: DNA-binding protein [Gammaproteobacteria bacterium]
MPKKSIRDIHSIHLRDPAVASEYLNEAFASGEQAVILMAVRNVVEAQEGGVASVAKRAHIGRESMYKMLSATGNPKLTSVAALFHGIGLQLCVKPEDTQII